MEEILIKITDVFSPELREKLENLCKENKLEVAFKYISDFRNTGLLRNYVSELCSMCNLDKTWIGRITLITDELNNNAIEYGSKPGEYNKMIFKLKDLGDYLYVEIVVEDTGHGPRAKNAEEMYKLKEEKDKKGFKGYMGIRGRGLFLIIEKIVDDLIFEDTESGGLRVIVKKKIKK